MTFATTADDNTGAFMSERPQRPMIRSSLLGPRPSRTGVAPVATTASRVHDQVRPDPFQRVRTGRTGTYAAAVPCEPERQSPREGDVDIASRQLLDLVQHPERVADFTTADSASVLCQVASVLAVLAARLASSCADPQRAKPDDRLLTVDDVAQRLSMSSHAVYRRASGFPFTVHVGRYLRFSERGLEEYLERRRGR